MPSDWLIHWDVCWSFSIGGGLIIVPVLHVMYPEIDYQDIIIISIHQIF